MGAIQSLLPQWLKRYYQQGRDLNNVITRLEHMLGTEERLEQFLDRPRSDSQNQALIDLLQLVLDVPTLDTRFKANLIDAAQRIAMKTRFYPRRYGICKDLTLDNISFYRYGGAFATFHRANIGNQYICLKEPRMTGATLLRGSLSPISFAEIILWGQLKHTNILPFLGVYEIDSKSFLASLLSQNGDIIGFLGDNGHNADTDRVMLALDVAQGVAYLHENGIIHGDLKSSDVSVHHSGRAVIANFELSTTVSGSRHFAEAGCARFAAPEMFMGSGLTKAIDMYSLACILYEIFTNERPFSRTKLETSIIYQVLCGKRPQRPHRLSPSWTDWGLTESIWLLMQVCWADDPTVRPTIKRFVEQISLETSHTDERPTLEETASHGHFQRTSGGCKSTNNHPTTHELEALLGVTHSIL